MHFIFYDGHKYYNTVKFNKSLHVKDKRIRHNATIKKSDINTFDAVGDY